MDALFKSLGVALVPQPQQLPPAPLPQGTLRELFGVVVARYPYQQYASLPGETGAQFLNGPEDLVMIEPLRISIQVKMYEPDVSPEAARDRAAYILREASERLGMGSFIACGIRVVAHAEAPGGSAREYVGLQLVSDAVDPGQLGAGFHAAGVKFRATDPEQTLSVEPFVQDDGYLFIAYDVGRSGVPRPIEGVDEVSGWVDEAFRLVSERTMELLTMEES